MMATLKDLQASGVYFYGGLEIVAPNGETLYRKETCDFYSPSFVLAYLMGKPVKTICASHEDGKDAFFRVFLSDEVMRDDDFIQLFRSLGKAL